LSDASKKLMQNFIWHLLCGNEILHELSSQHTPVLTKDIERPQNFPHLFFQTSHVLLSELLRMFGCTGLQARPPEDLVLIATREERVSTQEEDLSARVVALVAREKSLVTEIKDRVDREIARLREQDKDTLAEIETRLASLNTTRTNLEEERSRINGRREGLDSSIKALEIEKTEHQKAEAALLRDRAKLDEEFSRCLEEMERVDGLRTQMLGYLESIIALVSRPSGDDSEIQDQINQLDAMKGLLLQQQSGN